MKTVICNSAQSFWDMADNHFLDGQEVHCVFPVNTSMKRFILSYQTRCNIKNISFSSIFEEDDTSQETVKKPSILNRFKSQEIQLAD
ncbi:hypothetical protein [Vibrio tapetis]|uniref:Exonuclease V subunit gamma n=1 Tax=Vibrio tapetis subsp. tapetis TaxID=1671868 RepID=A0A2N8ZC55_9VIBR|nr:hypothetical protein [Vibrio tapetis]SON49481.1 conserved protein of unknown function [Vibrio tapetis subsp. tapetis]